jgi:MFS family permease
VSGSAEQEVLAGTGAVGTAASAEVPLWRNRDFQLLWSGSAFAFLGKEITDLVYPLIVLAVTGSAAWAGAFGGVQLVVALLVGLPAGVLADRYDRRRLLIVMETVRALATGSLVVAVLNDAVTLPHLLVVAVAVGAVGPLGGTARMLLVRSVVPPGQLTAALTQEEVRSHSAALAGPPLGGLLYATAAVLPFLVTAVSFVIALVCAVFVRSPARAARQESTVDSTPPVRAAFSGLVQLWAVPILRHSTLFAAVLTMVMVPVTFVVIVLLNRNGAAPGMVGLTVAGFAVGGLAGAALVRPLHNRLSPGLLMLWLGGVDVVLITALSLPFGPWWLAATLFLLGLGGPAMRVLIDILIFRQVPDEQRGRTINGFMTVLTTGGALGLVGSGLLLEFLPATAAILAPAGVLAVALGISVADRRIRTVQWPSAHEER